MRGSPYSTGSTGANTGLVGASTPDGSATQVVLSTSRLRQRCDIDAANRSVTVDAGMTLQELNEKLEPLGLWFPVDLGPIHPLVAWWPPTPAERA